MNDSPGEGRVTDDPTELTGDLWQDRPVGWPGQAFSSSLDLSHAIAKCVTLPAIPLEDGFYLRDSQRNRWLLPLVATSISFRVTTILVKFSRDRERLTVPAASTISPISQLVEELCQATGGRGGDFPSGRGCHEHTERPTECRMGESPESQARSAENPGTQGAKRPSSFRRGREGARFRGSVRRRLSVTCLLRHFPPPARTLSAGRAAKSGKSGVSA
jgi:hypothetical protein